MALQLGALRDALLEAGATPAKADKASEELASYENRLAGIESRLATLTWMATINIALLGIVTVQTIAIIAAVAAIIHRGS